MTPRSTRRWHAAASSWTARSRYKHLTARPGAAPVTNPARHPCPLATSHPTPLRSRTVQSPARSAYPLTLVALLSLSAPKRKKPGAMAGFSGGCRPLSAVAPIEDDYFLQVDSGGSKRVLMPPANKWVRSLNARGMSVNTSPRLALLGAVCPALLLWIKVGQRRVPKSKTLPHCPTSFTFSSYIERLLRTRMRVKRAYYCPLRSHGRGAFTGGTVGQPSNDAACARPTALQSSGTRWAKARTMVGVVPGITQPSPSASQQCTGARRADAGSRCHDCNRNRCTSATGSCRGCSSAHAPPPTTAAAGVY